MDHPLEIAVSEVQKLLDSNADFLLLDCREPHEFEIAVIAGASLIPMSQIAQRLEEIPVASDKRIVVYCHHGGRSLRVATWLRENGRLQAQSMAGGIDRWAVEIDSEVARY
ncbi:MAG: rhodanese [Planctomycetales bacterium]|nr:rhodanese [Planctomycetales bacterium]